MDTEKIVSITYDTLEELFNRQDKMITTYCNYLARENNYRYIGYEIIFTETKRYKLVLKSELV